MNCPILVNPWNTIIWSFEKCSRNCRSTRGLLHYLDQHPKPPREFQLFWKTHPSPYDWYVGTTMIQAKAIISAHDKRRLYCNHTLFNCTNRVQWGPLRLNLPFPVVKLTWSRWTSIRSLRTNIAFLWITFPSTSQMTSVVTCNRQLKCIWTT